MKLQSEAQIKAALQAEAELRPKPTNLMRTSELMQQWRRSAYESVHQSALAELRRRQVIR
jgi:hypothetical protein